MNFAVIDLGREIREEENAPGRFLSPLPLNLALNSVLLSLDRDGRDVDNYADDVAIVVRVTFSSTLRDIMQTAIRDVGLIIIKR